MSRLIDADALIADMEKRYCKDCERRKGVKGGKVRMLYEIGEAPCRACEIMDAMDEIDNAPTIDAVPVWVSVKDRLPNEKINPNTHDFEYVLCYTIFGDVRAYKYGTPLLTKLPHFWNGGVRMDECVTHWMPLPEPPKEVTP